MTTVLSSNPICFWREYYSAPSPVFPATADSASMSHYRSHSGLKWAIQIPYGREDMTNTGTFLGTVNHIMRLKWMMWLPHFNE